MAILCLMSIALGSSIVTPLIHVKYNNIEVLDLPVSRICWIACEFYLYIAYQLDCNILAPHPVHHPSPKDYQPTFCWLCEIAGRSGLLDLRTIRTNPYCLVPNTSYPLPINLTPYAEHMSNIC